MVGAATAVEVFVLVQIDNITIVKWSSFTKIHFSRPRATPQFPNKGHHPQVDHQQSLLR